MNRLGITYVASLMRAKFQAGSRTNFLVGGAILFSLFALVWPFVAVNSQSGFTAEDNTDRPGADYKNFDLSQPNWTLCRDACANDGNCQAYTYVRPGVQAASARCWLKSSVPASVGNNCCISGAKGGGGSAGGGGGGNNVGNFAGEWDTGIDGYNFYMRLRQEGNRVTGDIDGSIGKIEGVVSGRTLRFRYTWRDSKGAGTYVLSDDGRTFNGFFSNTDDPDNRSRGFWNGRKR